MDCIALPFPKAHRLTIQMPELAAIMTRVAQRDRAAFAQLYNATSAKLYGVVLRILLRRDLSDEVLQEVYLKIWQKAVDFDAARSSPITWMVTIARNRALDVKRRKQPQSLEDLPDSFDIAAEIDDPLQSREQREALHQINRCMQGIEQPKRDMVLLAYLHGLSREQLAEKFNAPVATIKTWIHRSLTQLRMCLDAHAEESV
jgi:RNA polymerase sigma-70 factor (ECF subfamily)